MSMSMTMTSGSSFWMIGAMNGLVVEKTMKPDASRCRATVRSVGSSSSTWSTFLPGIVMIPARCWPGDSTGGPRQSQEKWIVPVAPGARAVVGWRTRILWRCGMVDQGAPGLPGAEEWGKGEFLDLFGADASRQPLAARMRPRSLDEYFGQDGIVGPGQLLRRAIEADRLSSLILWGPPGTGKTSLAAVIARGTKSHFETINAVMAGVADIRKVVAGAQRRRQVANQRTILLVDEIHRFNRAQQDALLPARRGRHGDPDRRDDREPVLRRQRDAALAQPRLPVPAARGRGRRPHPAPRPRRPRARPGAARAPRSTDEAIGHLVRVAGGDARTALNALELAVATTAARPGRRRRCASAWRRPSRASSTAPCATTARGTSTTTPSAPSSRACAAPTPTPRSTGWRRWSRPARTRASSCGAW